MELIGIIDQGTQSTKFSLFNEKLNHLYMASAEHQQHVPQPKWIEHDPLEILDKTCEVITKVIRMAEKDYGKFKLVSIGITNQRETIVLWDKYTGSPIYNAIVWHDMRTSSIVNDLVKQWSTIDKYQEITGLPISMCFSAMKIKWLLTYIDGLKGKLEDGTVLVGTIDTWLLWNLTGGIDGGVHLTDITNASRTFLMDLSTQSWCPQLLQEFGIPICCLPKIKSCSEVFGRIKMNNLPEIIQRVKICGIIGDQQAACVGHGLIINSCMEDTRMLKCTYGTGAFVLVCTGEKLPYHTANKNGLIITPCCQLGEKEPIIWAIEGYVGTAGLAITWLIDMVQLASSPDELENLCNSIDQHFLDNCGNNEPKLNEAVEDNDELVFVPAFCGLYSPRWQPSARATIIGLEYGTNKAKIVRALFEGIAFQINEIIESICKALKLRERPLIRMDGGMTKNCKLMQLTADLTSCNIVRPKDVEVTSLGAAIITGIGCKLFKNLEDIKNLLSVKDEERVIWQPKIAAIERQKKLAKWNKGIERSINWIDN